MATPVTTTAQDPSSDGLLAKDAGKMTTKVTSTAVMEASSQKKPAALSPEQIHSLVLDAFDSASSQLHAPNEEGMCSVQVPLSKLKSRSDSLCVLGILESIIPPSADIVTNGTAIGPQAAKLVEVDTHNNTTTGADQRTIRVAEPQEASQGSYLYLPGFGFIYQEDNSDLGSDDSFLCQDN